jgi:hypothetical protein
LGLSTQAKSLWAPHWAILLYALLVETSVKIALPFSGWFKESSPCPIMQKITSTPS